MGNLSLLQMTLPDDGDHVDVMMTASMCCLQLRRTLDDILVRAGGHARVELLRGRERERCAACRGRCGLVKQL